MKKRDIHLKADLELVEDLVARLSTCPDRIRKLRSLRNEIRSAKLRFNHRNDRDRGSKLRNAEREVRIRMDAIKKRSSEVSHVGPH